MPKTIATAIRTSSSEVTGPVRIDGSTSPSRLVRMKNALNATTPQTMTIATHAEYQSAPSVDRPRARTLRSCGRSNCGSGMSRMARTMLRFAARQEEKATVMNVSVTPSV